MNAWVASAKSLIIAALALVLDSSIVILAGGPRPENTSVASWSAQCCAQPVVLAWHLLFVFCFGLLVFVVPRHATAEMPALGLLWLLMVFLGPVGAFVGLLAAFTSWAMPRADAPTVYDDAPSSGKRPVSAGQSADAAAAESQSLSDIFRHGALAQKRRAVALIAGNFKPQFAAALQMALKDEHNAIRVQAGMALLHLEDEFGRQQIWLERQGDAQLTSHGFGQDNVHLQQARLHDQTADSGLWDAERTQGAQLMALKAYKQHLAAHPDDEEAISAIGRLFVRADQHQLVADWFSELAATRPVSDAILTWLAEALFLSKRYDELRQLVARFGPRLERHLPVDSPLHGALQMWRPQTSAKL